MWAKDLTIKELPKQTKDKWLAIRMKTTKDIIDSKKYRILNNKNNNNDRR